MFFEIKEGYLRYTRYKNSLVFTEKSTNSQFFQPVITDGTVAGTKLVTDYINDLVPGSVSNVISAVGTQDFLFVMDGGSGGKVFNGTSIDDFDLNGDYFHGFKIGQKHVVMTDFSMFVYDSATATSSELPVEPYYFSEPIANGPKVFFHNSQSYVYETDGTPTGTKKISSLTAGESNYDPYVFATEDQLLYSVNNAGNTELWIVDLVTGADSLFTRVKSASSFYIQPYVFKAGDNIVYARYTSAEGREYWVYNPGPTATHDPVPHIDLRLVPNPATHELELSFGDDLLSLTKLTLFNSEGKPVKEIPIDQKQMKIDLHQVSPGLYYVQVSNDRQVFNGGSFVKI